MPIEMWDSIKAMVAIDDNWLQEAVEAAVEERTRRFERHDPFPTKELTKTIPNRFAKEKPQVFIVKFFPPARDVVAANRQARVVDMEVINSSVPELVKEGTIYSMWFTTVFGKCWDEIAPKEDVQYIVAYFGMFQKGKKPSSLDPHIFSITPRKK